MKCSKFQLIAIQDGIGGLLLRPIAKEQHLGIGKLATMRQVHVAKYITLHIAMLNMVSLGILLKRTQALHSYRTRTMRLTRTTTPPTAKLKSQIGMNQPAKEPACNRRAKRAIHKAEHKLPIDI